MVVKRRPIDKNVRELVWKNYFKNKNEGKCPCCEERIISILSCHISHKVSLANGGSNSLKNLIPLCSQCNTSMGTMSYREYRLKVLGKHPRPFTKPNMKEIDNIVKKVKVVDKLVVKPLRKG